MRSVFLAGVLALVPLTAAAQRGPASELGDPAAEYRPGAVAEEVPEAPGAVVETGTDDAPGDAELSDRLRALDASYTALASGAGPNWFNIILSLVGGAAQLGFGIAFTQIDDVSAPPGSVVSCLAPYFITLGTVALARTIVVDIVMRPDPTGVALQYQHMPSMSRANRLERLRYGEQQLDALADYSFMARMVDAGLNVAGAAASMIAYFAPRNLDLYPFDALESFIFIGPAISLIMAIVTLASPSEAEQRRDAYHRLRQTLRERRGQREVEEGDYDEDVPPPPRAGLSLQIGGGIDPNGGGLLSVGAAF